MNAIEIADLLATGAGWLRLAGAWTLTYLIHSTILLAAAWAVARRLAGRAPRAEELVWRVGLFAGFLTASAQLAAPGVAAAIRDLLTPTASSLVATAPAAQPVEVVLVGATPEVATATTLPLGLAAGATVAWAATVALGIALLALAVIGLRRRLAGRREVAHPGVRRELAELLAATGETPVRLTEGPGLGAPIALGVLRREICLPRRVVVSLGERERRALLAHELAHHARRDPAWVLLARLAETLGGVQPINRFARRRLGELAEWLADAKAVAWTGDPEGLARCLAEVASWRLPGQATKLAPAFAAEGRPTLERVRRLLARRPPEGRAAALRWTRVGAAAASFALVAFAPGVAPGSFAFDSDPTAEVGAPAPAPQPAPSPLPSPQPRAAQAASASTPLAASAARAAVAPVARPAESAEPERSHGARRLTPEERAALEREIRRAQQEARRAAEEVRQALATTQAEMQAEIAAAAPSREEIARQVAEARAAAAAALVKLPEEKELRELRARVEHEVQRGLAGLDNELHQAFEKSRQEMEAALAEAREKMPDGEEMARLRAEVSRDLERAHRELDREHRQEIERLAAEMNRIQSEIAPQLHELERLGERIGREVEEALSGLDLPPVPPAPAVAPEAPAKPRRPAAAPAPVVVTPPPAVAPQALVAPEAPEASEPPQAADEGAGSRGGSAAEPPN